MTFELPQFTTDVSNQKQFATNSRSSHIAMVLKSLCAWYLTPNVNAARGNDAVAGHQVTTESIFGEVGERLTYCPRLTTGYAKALREQYKVCSILTVH